MSELITPKGFIYWTAVSPSPGNPKRAHLHRVTDVLAVAECSPEHAQIGAAALIDTTLGTFYVTETMEEIAQRIYTATAKDF